MEVLAAKQSVLAQFDVSKNQLRNNELNIEQLEAAVSITAKITLQQLAGQTVELKFAVFEEYIHVKIVFRKFCLRTGCFVCLHQVLYCE